MTRDAFVLALAIAFSLPRGEPAHAQALLDGFVRVETPKGANIELDGKLRARANGEEPVILRAIAAGAHKIRATLEGHVEQVRFVQVEPGAVAVVRLRPFIPLATSDDGARAESATGALWIEAVAHEATVDAKPFGWKKIPLGGEPLIAPQVAAGRQKLTFCNPEKCLDFRVDVPARDIIALVVDFGAPAVIDVTRAKKDMWHRAEQSCEATLHPADCLVACNSALALGGSALSPACARLEPANARATTLADAKPSEPPLLISSRRDAPPCIPLQGASPGFVTIRSESMVDVYFGDKRLGSTPLTGIELPAGCVELRAVIPGHEGSRHFPLEVEPNATTVYHLKL